MKRLFFALLLILAAALCLSACSSGGLKLEEITDENLASYVTAEHAFVGHKSISWVREQETSGIAMRYDIQMVKEGDAWIASFTGESDDGTKLYGTSEYSKENGGFEYNATLDPDYEFLTLSIAADECTPDQHAASLWDLIMDGGDPITEKKEDNGRAVITTTQVMDGVNYTMVTVYTLDMKTGDMISCDYTMSTEDGEVLTHLLCKDFVYDGDVKLDTTAKDMLTSGDICKASFVMVAEDGTTHTRTATVRKGCYGGSASPLGYELKFYEDEACTQETTALFEGDEVTYYCKLVKSEY